MIDLRKLAQFQYQKNIMIICNDGQIIKGNAGEVDDEEESGLDEPGITVYTNDGSDVEIGLSEINSIQVI